MLNRIQKGFLLVFLLTFGTTETGQSVLEEVSGSLQLEDKKVEINHVYARLSKSRIKKDAISLALLFTKDAIPDKNDQDYIPAGSVYLSYSFLSDSMVIGDAVFLKEGHLYHSFSASDRILLTKIGIDRVSGRVKRYKYQTGDPCFDLKFSAELVTVKEELAVPHSTWLGKDLPADGGEPAKSYLEYLEDVRKGNMDGVLSKTKGEFFNRLGFKVGFADAKDFVPAQVKIASGFSNDQSATIFLIGKLEDGTEQIAAARLIVNEGKWKVSDDKFIHYMR